MHTYCIYLTTYSGNKLPPFYIGYSKTENVISRGYRGSVTSKKYKSVWLSELKNSPGLFNTTIIQTFTSKKEAQARELHIQQHLSVSKNPLYINMSITGHSDNTRLRVISSGMINKMKYNKDPMPEGYRYGYSDDKRASKFGVGSGIKKNYTEEGMRRKKLAFSGDRAPAKRKDVRDKISDTVKELWKNGAYADMARPDMNGIKNPFYGKKHKEETNRTNSDKHMNRVVVIDLKGNKLVVTKEEFLSRIDLVGVNAGKNFYTNEKNNILLYKADDIPEGYYKGRTLKLKKEEK